MSQLQVNWSALSQGAEIAARGQTELQRTAERINSIRAQLVQELHIGLEFSMLDQRKRSMEQLQRVLGDMDQVLDAAAEQYRTAELSNKTVNRQ